MSSGRGLAGGGGAGPSLGRSGRIPLQTVVTEEAPETNEASAEQLKGRQNVLGSAGWGQVPRGSGRGPAPTLPGRMTSGRARPRWPVCDGSDSQSGVWARGGVPRWEAGKRRSRPKPGRERRMRTQRVHQSLCSFSSAKAQCDPDALRGACDVAPGCPRRGAAWVPGGTVALTCWPAEPSWKPALPCLSSAECVASAPSAVICVLR